MNGPAEAGRDLNPSGAVWDRFADRHVCDLTTRGRRTGRPHTIEIWFAVEGATLYLLSGGGDRADWVRNLRAVPAVTITFGDHTVTGRARAVATPDEDGLARRALARKYRGWREGELLDDWARTALPIAVEC